MPRLASHSRAPVSASTGPPRPRCRRVSTWVRSRSPSSMRSMPRSRHSAVARSDAASSVRMVATSWTEDEATSCCTTVSDVSSSRFRSSISTTGRSVPRRRSSPATRRSRMRRNSSIGSDSDVSAAKSSCSRWASAPRGTEAAVRVATARPTGAPERAAAARHSSASLVLPTPGPPTNSTPAPPARTGSNAASCIRRPVSGQLSTAETRRTLKISHQSQIFSVTFVSLWLLPLLRRLVVFDRPSQPFVETDLRFVLQELPEPN